MLEIKPKDKTVTKTMRLPENLASRLEQIAKENNTTFTSVVEQCLEYALDNIQDGCKGK
ncbi:MAG: hypothetical protein IKU32_03735 [Clostridia bacterium]|nr:hypothetical protein [Clostridia bacterium]